MSESAGFVLTLSPDVAAQRAAWEIYATGRPGASAYHRFVWLDILHAAFGHPIFPLACRKNGVISGILPLMLVSSRLFGRFLVSLPFVNYGGPLADDEDSAQLLLAEANRLMHAYQARSVELRHCPAELSSQYLDRLTGQASDTFPGEIPAGRKVGMILPLPQGDGQADRLWGGLKDKVRNQVRKARKAGLAARFGGEELLDDFYRVFCVNMRALGTPVYGRAFFAEILRRLPGEAFIIAVHEGAGRCLAAGLLLGRAGVLEMPWASSLPAFRPLCANTLLYWEALRHGCAAGHRLFDFGRSSPGGGPWRFKKQWGAEEIPLPWEYLLPPGQSPPRLNLDNPKYRLAIRAWKRLPLAAANFFGPRIVRCIP